MGEPRRRITSMAAVETLAAQAVEGLREVPLGMWDVALRQWIARAYETGRQDAELIARERRDSESEFTAALHSSRPPPIPPDARGVDPDETVRFRVPSEPGTVK